jgi:hypothetical protein
MWVQLRTANLCEETYVRDADRNAKASAIYSGCANEALRKRENDTTGERRYVKKLLVPTFAAHATAGEGGEERG